MSQRRDGVVVYGSAGDTTRSKHYSTDVTLQYQDMYQSVQGQRDWRHYLQDARRIQNRKNYKIQYVQNYAERLALGKKELNARNVASKGFHCDICKTICASQKDLRVHLSGPKHRSKAADAANGIVSPHAVKSHWYKIRNKGSIAWLC